MELVSVTRKGGRRGNSSGTSLLRNLLSKQNNMKNGIEMPINQIPFLESYLHVNVNESYPSNEIYPKDKDPNQK